MKTGHHDRLKKALLETAADMSRIGAMAAHEMITVRHLIQRPTYPPAHNLYERIRARLEPLGGADDLELPLRLPHRDPPGSIAMCDDG